MLCLNPESVDRGQITESLGVQTEAYRARGRFLGVARGLNLAVQAPTGVTGIAAAGSAEKGERLLSLVTEKLVTFLRQYREDPF